VPCNPRAWAAQTASAKQRQPSVSLCLKEFGTAVLCLLFIVVFDTAGVGTSDSSPFASVKFLAIGRFPRSSMALANKLDCLTDEVFCQEQSTALGGTGTSIEQS